jgi:hypothetical protein
VYAALVTACYLPLNNVRYVNRTLWDEDRTNLASHGPNLGWVTVVGGNNAAQPWPRDSARRSALITIQYCYATQAAKDILKRCVESANKLW